MDSNFKISMYFVLSLPLFVIPFIVYFSLSLARQTDCLATMNDAVWDIGICIVDYKLLIGGGRA